MNKRYSILLAFSLLLFLLLHSACTEDKIAGGEGGGKHTVRLTLSVSTTPIPETKAVVQRARSGSEAEAAGFSYELVSSDADTMGTAVLTKAPAILKNVYALLFTSTGAFNGRANLGTVAAKTATYIEFKDVEVANATGCRLVIVANDNDATTSYSSSRGTGNFDNFKGTYSDFQALAMTSTIGKDEDVPYAGSLTNVNLTDFSTLIAVPLYRTLAKVTLENAFNISDGPARSSITLYNAGTPRFATTRTDSYDGTGDTETSGFVESITGSNANITTWYVGENIRPAGSGIKSIADRNSKNAPENACYIRIGTAIMSIAANTNPAIGEEYITSSGSKKFTYDIYLGKSSELSDFSLRRHTNYTIYSDVSGTLARQEQLAASDGRVTLSKSGGESAGLNIGKLGGGTYTNASPAPAVTGSYKKYLLLQPNTSEGTATDNIYRKWSDNTTAPSQSENRRYWDPTYTLNNIDNTSGYAYDYCYNLTLGGVPKGTWYLPTQAQLMAIYRISKGLKNGRFVDYAAFDTDHYWSSAESDATRSWSVSFNDGFTYYGYGKTGAFRVRCVRDLP